jgi:hypothetical protein
MGGTDNRRILREKNGEEIQENGMETDKITALWERASFREQ